MDEHGVEKSRAQSLAEVLEMGVDDRPLWRPGELSAILKHQLSAPLELDLAFGGPAPPRHSPAGPGQGPAIESFRDLLHHPNPPIELLESTKEFAKACRARPDAPLPDEIATILYLLAIVAATTRCRRRITKLDDQSLLRKLDWAVGQPWVDESTRALLREGQRAIGVKEPDWHG